MTTKQTATKSEKTATHPTAENAFTQQRAQQTPTQRPDTEGSAEQPLTKTEKLLITSLRENNPSRAGAVLRAIVNQMPPAIPEQEPEVHAQTTEAFYPILAGLALEKSGDVNAIAWYLFGAMIAAGLLPVPDPGLPDPTFKLDYAVQIIAQGVKTLREMGLWNL